MGALPSYSELCQRTDAPPGSSWGLFGPDDELGTLNLLTAERARAAARSVRTGDVFRLDLPLDAFDPALVSSREAPIHSIFQRSTLHRDDRLDRFFPQASSQIDGLRHFRHWVHGFYNGIADDKITEGTATLGMGRWAEHGIVGRGVLVDMPRYFAARGDLYDPRTPRRFRVAELNAALELQGVSLQEGDILLLRTGWLSTVLAHEPHERQAYRLAPSSPGLEQSEDMLAWLWDHHLAMVAADNLAVEALPPDPESPFTPPPGYEAVDDPHQGLMHRVLIPMLGFALGELWNLEALAKDCHETGIWESMIVSAPLFLPAGVGSPANAVAIR